MEEDYKREWVRTKKVNVMAYKFGGRGRLQCTGLGLTPTVYMQGCKVVLPTLPIFVEASRIWGPFYVLRILYENFSSVHIWHFLWQNGTESTHTFVSLLIYIVFPQVQARIVCFMSSIVVKMFIISPCFWTTKSSYFWLHRVDSPAMVWK